MEATTVFNPIQLYLLKLFSRIESEQELEEVKQVLSDYYFKKVEEFIRIKRKGHIRNNIISFTSQSTSGTIF